MSKLLCIRFFTVCCSCVLLFGSAMAQKAFNLKGAVSSPVFENNTVLLSYHDGKSLRYDTTRVRQGKFEVKGNIQKPVKVFIFIGYSREQIELSKKKGENRQFYLCDGNTTISGIDLQSARIAGGREQEEFARLQKSLNHVERTGSTANNDEIVGKRNQACIDFMRSNPNSVVSFDLMSGFANPNFFADHVKEMEMISRTFPKEWQDSKDGKRVSGLIAGALKLGLGKTAIDFTMNDVEGKPVNLSDYRGQYVLLDFWASWCVPCRAENPHVLNAYEKFKDHKFTVLSVSLDKESAKKEWLAAIAKDKLPWKQVSDLKGWDNVAARAYDVQSIPMNYLIDPQGKIVAVGLRGENLVKQLEKLL
jgi:peroxiredoxin